MNKTEKLFKSAGLIMGLVGSVFISIATEWYVPGCIALMIVGYDLYKGSKYEI